MPKVPTLCPFILKKRKFACMFVDTSVHTHTYTPPQNTGIHCPWQFNYAVGPLNFNLDSKRKIRDGADDSYPHLSFSCKAALLGMLELDPVRLLVASGPSASVGW